MKTMKTMYFLICIAILPFFTHAMQPNKDSWWRLWCKSTSLFIKELADDITIQEITNNQHVTLTNESIIQTHDGSFWKYRIDKRTVEIATWDEVSTANRLLLLTKDTYPGCKSSWDMVISDDAYGSVSLKIY